MNRSPCTIQRQCCTGCMSGPVRLSAVTAGIAIVLATLVATSPSWGALYKWTDANGRVVYSDQPPTGDVKVDTISGPPPPSNPNAVKELAEKGAESKKQQQEAAVSAKKAAQQRADAEKRSSVCRDARAELARLSADQILLYSINEKGETVFMNDGDRRRRREVLETQLKANCPPG